MKIALAALFLLAILVSVPLCVASGPVAAPAPSQVTLAPAYAPGFASWLAEQHPPLGPEPAAKCRTCLQCPAGTFCCIGANGCASCTTRPTPCIQARQSALPRPAASPWISL